MVYEGVFLNQAVTVKRLVPELAKDEYSRDVFMYEAKVAAQLDHPKIVRFVGVYWTTVSDIGSVFERMSGGELNEYLAAHYSELVWTRPARPSMEERPASASDVELPTKLQLAIDVAEALVLLHSFHPPIAHGNLSSKSVWLDGSGTAKLWNFRPVGVEALAHSMMDTSRSGTVTGTRTMDNGDICAFGQLLVELDWCEPAQSHLRPVETPADALVMSELIEPEFTSSCPPVVTQLARRCLVFSPYDRPTAIEIFYELRKLADSER
ncbi:TPA: hypothetical protein N0F65_000709 [Lagenidium giganteum]|uniref:Protein kinase domain-containing protein n=1 Tax=Lagenidium giganteum TaxID=4803 RepID=A0AAV2ZC43_9STRA|nr:TPA: hypothetical protein N0F65_000709 [Lagenidium giganteum]